MGTLQRKKVKKSTPNSTVNTDTNLNVTTANFDTPTVIPDVTQTGNPDVVTTNPDMSENVGVTNTADDNYLNVLNGIVLHTVVESHNTEINPENSMTREG